jgi:hypothetical protein
LGGKDDLPNMNLLNRSVNRSLGSQVAAQIRDHPIGTRYGRIYLE